MLTGHHRWCWVRHAQKMWRHPDYDPWWLSNDVALFELEEPVEGIEPVKLAAPGLVGDFASLHLYKTLLEHFRLWQAGTLGWQHLQADPITSHDAPWRSHFDATSR